jgi:hypothetical protein
LKKDYRITKDGKLPLPQLLYGQNSLDSVLRSRQMTLINALKVIDHTRVEIKLLCVLIYSFRCRRSYLRGLDRRKDLVFGYRVANLCFEIMPWLAAIKARRGDVSGVSRCVSSSIMIGRDGCEASIVIGCNSLLLSSFWRFVAFARLAATLQAEPKRLLLFLGPVIITIRRNV